MQQRKTINSLSKKLESVSLYSKIAFGLSVFNTLLLISLYVMLYW